LLSMAYSEELCLLMVVFIFLHCCFPSYFFLSVLICFLVLHIPISLPILSK